jgi:hypothetical protein
MIEKLKEVGIRFEIIKTVRDEMQRKPVWSNEIDAILNLLIENKPEIYDTKEGKKKIAVKRKILTNQSNIQTYFSNLVAISVLNKSPLSFLINLHGEVLHIDSNNSNSIFEDNKFIGSFKNLYISISVTEIIQEFIQKSNTGVIKHNLDLISKEELSVLLQLEDEALTKLIIHSGDSQINLFDLSDETKVKTLFLNFITSHDYDYITVLNNRGTETKFLSPKQIKKSNEKLSTN